MIYGWYTIPLRTTFHPRGPLPELPSSAVSLPSTNLPSLWPRAAARGTNCPGLFTQVASLSFQQLPHCPVCKPFVLTFIQHAGGSRGSRKNLLRYYLKSAIDTSLTVNTKSRDSQAFLLLVFKRLRTLPSYVCSKSFASHSYENCRGVGAFFPFWNVAPSRLAARTAFADLVSGILSGPHGTRITGHGSRSTFNFRLSAIANGGGGDRG